jgi:hypothetical protein
MFGFDTHVRDEGLGMLQVAMSMVSPLKFVWTGPTNIPHHFSIAVSAFDLISLSLRSDKVRVDCTPSYTPSISRVVGLHEAKETRTDARRPGEYAFVDCSPTVHALAGECLYRPGDIRESSEVRGRHGLEHL